VATIAFGYLARRGPIRHSMALAAVLLASGGFGLIWVHASWSAYLAAGVFGMGIGGILTLLPIAWADYFGRESYGAIRGVALSLQVLAQAVGPVLSGVLRDWSGDYVRSLIVFGALSSLAVMAALAAQRPRGAR
jgi:cyanate permease